MLTREIPFADMSPMSVMWLVASQKKRLPIPSKCPQPFSELMESCWYEKPTDRPSAKTVIQLLQRYFLFLFQFFNFFQFPIFFFQC